MTEAHDAGRVDRAPDEDPPRTGEDPGPLRPRSALTRRWVSLLGLALLAGILGFVGFRHYFVARHETASWLDCVYQTVQLFTLESGDVTGLGVTWELEVARFLAPLVAVSAIVLAMLSFFRTRYDLLRTRSLRRHIVLCGDDRRAVQLARSLLRTRANRGRVVVITESDDGETGRACREAGARLCPGRGTDPETLRRAGVHRAATLVSLYPGDGANVEVAVRARELLVARGRPASNPCRGYFHVIDLASCTLLRRHLPLRQGQGVLHGSVINVFEAAARKLFEETPLDRCLTDPADARAVRLVVLGFGNLGEAVVLQAARIGHFANGKPLRVSVVAAGAEVRWRRFRERYPRLGEVCEVEYLPGSLEDPQVLEQVCVWAADPGSLVTIADCVESDAPQATEAEQARPAMPGCRAMEDDVTRALALFTSLNERGVHLVVGLARLRTLRDLLPGTDAKPSSPHCVSALAVLDDVCSQPSILGDEQDALARAIHEDYLAEYGPKDGAPPTRESHKPWLELNEDIRDSSRQQADHLAVKLRALGCRAVAIAADAKPAEPFKFTEQDVDLLARMEHARWCGGYRLAGWTYGPGDPDPVRKTHPNLVPWDQLPEAVRDKDRSPVRRIPKLLELVGKRIVPEAAPDVVGRVRREAEGKQP